MPDLSQGNTLGARARPSRPATLGANETVAGCRVIGRLGRGGMGEVYEVEHVRLGKRFALKIILPEFATDPGFVERFEREAKLTARLEHPNIVRVDDFGEDGGRYWLRMELAGGVGLQQLPGLGGDGRVKSLAELMREAGGRLPESLVAVLARGMLEGLAHAHARGVVHRDLKLANVLLVEGRKERKDRGGRPVPKVADFGLARVIGEGLLRDLAERSVNLDPNASPSAGRTRADSTTSAAARGGTYEFRAPEQRRGERAGSASDVYAAGLVVYRLLTGRQTPGFQKPSESAPGLDPFWDGFLAKALEEEPGVRFADAGAMLDALSARAVLQVPSAGPDNVLADALSARTEARRLQALALLMTEQAEPAIARMRGEAQDERAAGEAAEGAGDDTRGEAVSHFARSREMFTAAFAGAEEMAACAKAESGMRSAEEAAREVRADGFAPGDFEAAARAKDAAARARADGEFERASRLYSEAARAFDLARETAAGDAALRSEMLELHARALDWKHRAEPALAMEIERADRAASKVDEALSRRDRARAVSLAEEARALYRGAFAREGKLRNCMRLEDEAVEILDEALALGAEVEAPRALAKGSMLLHEARGMRERGEFEDAFGRLREAKARLREARDLAANVRARHQGKWLIVVVAILIAAVAAVVAVAWLGSVRKVKTRRRPVQVETTR